MWWSILRNPYSLFLALAGVFVLALMLRAFRRPISRFPGLRQSIDKANGDARRCLGCGYDLTGLAVPRCPECGALWGFTKSMNAIGCS